MKRKRELGEARKGSSRHCWGGTKKGAWVGGEREKVRQHHSHVILNAGTFHSAHGLLWQGRARLRSLKAPSSAFVRPCSHVPWPT